MTVPLFLFGTLKHQALLDLVAGERVVTRPAHLPGHALQGVKDAPFPILVTDPESATEGLLTMSLSPQARARIDFYETVFDHHSAQITIEVAGVRDLAEVYVPPDGCWTPEGDWSLTTWETEHAALTRYAAAEIMARRGITETAALRRLMPFIRARAWARCLAERRPAPTALRRATQIGDVELVKDSTPHEGFFRLKQVQLRTRRYDGTASATMERETFLGFDAALVLPYDPVLDRVLLVEQVRLAPFWRGDPEPFLLEPVAGIVDAGEEPSDAARREAREEAGLEIEDMIPVATGYPAPGYVTEYHHCFIGLCSLDRPVRRIGGVASEDEDIVAHTMSFDAALALVDSGEINVTPLILLLMRLERLRPSLRARS